jgi:hypothetical protein
MSESWRPPSEPWILGLGTDLHVVGLQSPSILAYRWIWQTLEIPVLGQIVLTGLVYCSCDCMMLWGTGFQTGLSNAASVNSECASIDSRPSLQAVNWVDEGMVKRIRGVAYSTRVSPQMANRMVDSARGVLNRLLPDVYIFTDHYTGAESGK